MKYNYYVIVVCVILIIFFSIAREPEQHMDQPHIGNFALPISQQPAPFIGFGENIVDKGDSMLFCSPRQLKGNRTNLIEVVPSFLYGISDKSSVYIEIPAIVKYKIEDIESHGLSDIVVQFELLTYAKETQRTAVESTFVFNIGLPTGSTHKDPPTGLGGPSVFLGFTASYTNPEWYIYASSGFLFTPAHKNTKFGNEFVYEFGLSRNISYKTDKWILNWIIEFDGSYKQRDTLEGFVDCNSGGNTLLLGPSLWFSTPHIIIQVGASGVVSQYLFGCQPRDKYYVAGSFGWKF